MSFLLLAAGLALLLFGGHWLVSGADGLARRLGVPAFVIGALVMGFGTSAPELMVSVLAALDGSGGIAVGNVIGSNVANIGLILALATLTLGAFVALLPITLLIGIVAATRWTGPQHRLETFLRGVLRGRREPPR